MVLFVKFGRLFMGCLKSNCCSCYGFKEFSNLNDCRGGLVLLGNCLSLDLWFPFNFNFGAHRNNAVSGVLMNSFDVLLLF